MQIRTPSNFRRPLVKVGAMQGNAAKILEKAPGAMQLRQLETLGNIAGDKTNTIVFPLDSMIT